MKKMMMVGHFVNNSHKVKTIIHHDVIFNLFVVSKTSLLFPRDMCLFDVNSHFDLVFPMLQKCNKESPNAKFGIMVHL
jgi:hypothetical protein